MSNQLVIPIFYVYKLTFKSGKTYIGSHKQIKEQDNYVTSSSYYSRHHNEDPLIKREILIKVESQYQMDFLETWCILSDKAYNKDNVNYNLGNFFHRFSTAYHTEEEKQAAIKKRKLTMSRKSPEELKAIVDKQKQTMSLKSKEELDDIHYRQGRNKSGNTHKSEWWASISESEKEETKSKMSKAKSEWFTNASDNQIKQFKKKCSTIRKEYFENMTDDDLNKFKQRCKIRELKRWKNASEDEKTKRCKGFYETAEKRKKKIRCKETGEIFESLQDVRKWLGPKVRGCNISAQANGNSHYHYAYRHPVTNEPLHWEFV